MWVARKAKGEHEQEKHNTSYASKSGVVSHVSSDQARKDNPDTKVPMQEPWSRWVEMQQQLMAAVKVCQKPSSNRGQRRNSQSATTSSQSSQQQGSSQNGDTARNNQPRQEGGAIENRFCAIIAKGGGLCIMIVQALKTKGL